MTGFLEVPLRDLCEQVQYGVTTSASSTTTGPKLLRITDIVPERVDWRLVPHCDIPERDVEKYALHAGDIVVARTGATVGYAKHLTTPPPRAVFASYLVRFRVRDDVDSRYVGYVVESSAYKQFIAANAGGAAQPNANAKTLGSFRVSLPDRETQRRIGTVLSAFDKLIEVNERRIELLEDLARSLYREWFLRFRFPRHQDVELVDSKVGRLPKGWSVGRLSDVADVVVEGVHPSELDPASRYVGLEHLPRRHTTLREWGSADSVSSRKLLFSRGDTLFGKIRPYFHKVVWAPFAAAASSDTIVLRAQPHLGLSGFVNAVASSDELVAEAVATSNGTKMPRADPNALLAYKLPLPDQALLFEFEGIVRRWLEWSAELVHQNRQLVMTRNLLLPRLVTGQVDTSDVDLGDLLPDEDLE